MRLRFLVPLAAPLLLAACGNGAEAPDELQGKWGADCSNPFVSFDGSTVHVYPDNADYDLKTAKLEGNAFNVSYDTKAGPVSETYIYENGTLRLDHGSYAGVEATWHKQPMQKCG